MSLFRHTIHTLWHLLNLVHLVSFFVFMSIIRRLFLIQAKSSKKAPTNVFNKQRFLHPKLYYKRGYLIRWRKCFYTRLSIEEMGMDVEASSLSFIYTHIGIHQPWAYRVKGYQTVVESYGMSYVMIHETTSISCETIHRNRKERRRKLRTRT